VFAASVRKLGNSFVCNLRRREACVWSGTKLISTLLYPSPLMFSNFHIPDAPEAYLLGALIL
jgi:hypothetical protein